jgi:hypothetical protein
VGDLGTRSLKATRAPTERSGSKDLDNLCKTFKAGPATGSFFRPGAQTLRGRENSLPPKMADMTHRSEKE